jgi:hypothetical protein
VSENELQIDIYIRSTQILYSTVVSLTEWTKIMSQYDLNDLNSIITQCLNYDEEDIKLNISRVKDTVDDILIMRFSLKHKFKSYNWVSKTAIAVLPTLQLCC